MQDFMRAIVRERKTGTSIVLGVTFILAASLHFISDAELKIIPEFLPWRRQALYITGIFELLGGFGLFIPRFRRASAWGLATLLLAIFPANVYHAVKNVQFGGMLDSRLYQWGRLPFQFVFIWLLLWSTQPKTANKHQD